MFLFQVFPRSISRGSKKFNKLVWLRRGAAIYAILIVGLCNFIDMVNFEEKK